MNGRILLVVNAFIGLLLGHSPAHGVSQHAVQATLVEQQLIMQCTQELMIISWTTSYEEDVAGYKVHRLSLDGQQGNDWVNPIPLTAHGPGEYKVLDAQAKPGRRYLYRLYVFDASFRLSMAQQIVLANPAQPTCLYLPLMATAR
jgi:hypothetical protein